MSIEKFKKSVSWIESCLKQSVDHPVFDHLYHIRTDKGDHQFDAFVINSSQFEDAIAFLETWEGTIWLVIDGKLTFDVVEQFLFEQHRNIIPWFLDPFTAIKYNSLIARALDGINWEKSLTKNQLHFEWD